MTIKGLAQNIFLVLVILLFFPIIIGGVLNMPVGLSYVETESMMPQLEPGDGFMLIPSQLVDGYEIGDVITYNAQNFPYDYVTHRIVGVTSQGFITQGDNNTFTDQTGSFLEPYVKEEQIAGKVLELNGNIVSIPHFGDAINFIGDSIRGLSNRFYSFIGIDGVDEKVGSIVMSVGILAVLVFVWESLAGIIVKSRKIVRKKRPKARSNLLLYGVFILFLVFATSVSVISMSQNNLVEFVATEGNTSSRAVHVGDSVSMDLEVGNNGIIPIYAHVNPKDGIIEVEEETYVIGRDGSVTVQYTINSPEENGYYREYITLDIYLGIFPGSVMESMISINRYLPIIAMDILAIGVSIPLFLILKRELRSSKRTVSRDKGAKNVL